MPSLVQLSSARPRLSADRPLSELQSSLAVTSDEVKGSDEEQEPGERGIEEKETQMRLELEESSVTASREPENHMKVEKRKT